MSDTLSQQPLFIIGSPRSGTTLLRLMLTSHTQVIIPPECGFIIWLYKKYNSWGVVDNNLKSINFFIADLFHCKKFDTWGLSENFVREKIYLFKPANYKELCIAVISAYAYKIREDFRIWGDKNNFYLKHIRRLHDLYNEAKFLHIVRDGRDVVCSYREVMSSHSDSPYAPILPTEIAEISKQWANDVLTIDRNLSEVPFGQVMTIKYEDLVTNTSLILKDICNWLGVSYERDMEVFFKKNKEKNLEPALTLDWKKRTLLPVSDETVGRHLNLMSKENLSDFYSVGKGALEKFSYL